MDYNNIIIDYYPWNSGAGITICFGRVLQNPPPINPLNVPGSVVGEESWRLGLQVE